MSFCLRPNVCKKCGKPLTLFEGWTCLECEKAEQEPVLDKIRAEISDIAVKTQNEDKREGLYIAREIVDRHR